jgi:hypothetical protein
MRECSQRKDRGWNGVVNNVVWLLFEGVLGRRAGWRMFWADVARSWKPLALATLHSLTVWIDAEPHIILMRVRSGFLYANHQSMQQ